MKERDLSPGFRVLLGGIGAIALAAGLVVGGRQLRAASLGSPFLPTLAALVCVVVVAGGAMLLRGAIRGRIAFRDPQGQRIPSALTLMIIGLLALASVAVYLWHATRGEGPDSTAIEVCRGFYAQARSAGDSAVVDVRVPVTSRGQASVAVSCAALRTAGRLR